MNNGLKDSDSSFLNLGKSVRELKCGGTSVKDLLRSERSKAATTHKILEKVHAYDYKRPTVGVV